eukprot:3123981-Pyramimonas_sp.AAC.1
MTGECAAGINLPGLREMAAAILDDPPKKWGQCRGHFGAAILSATHTYSNNYVSSTTPVLASMSLGSTAQDSGSDEAWPGRPVGRKCRPGAPQ